MPPSHTKVALGKDEVSSLLLAPIAFVWLCPMLLLIETDKSAAMFTKSALLWRDFLEAFSVGAGVSRPPANLDGRILSPL